MVIDIDFNSLIDFDWDVTRTYCGEISKGMI